MVSHTCACCLVFAKLQRAQFSRALLEDYKGYYHLMSLTFMALGKLPPQSFLQAYQPQVIKCFRGINIRHNMIAKRILEKKIGIVLLIVAVYLGLSIVMYEYWRREANMVLIDENIVIRMNFLTGTAENCSVYIELKNLGWNYANVTIKCDLILEDLTLVTASRNRIYGPGQKTIEDFFFDSYHFKDKAIKSYKVTWQW